MYFLLLAMQTVGAVIIYWKGIPLYRQLEANPASYAARDETVGWSIAATALIQTGYWLRYRLRPAMPHPVNVFGGHILLFLARLVFILATAAFSLVFITQEIAAHMPPWRYALVVVVLFSLFCYMQELQHLGNAMLRGSHSKD